MDIKALTDIVDLAWADIRGAEPTVLGMVTIVVTRDRDGDTDMHIVSTAPPEAVVSLLLEAAQRWHEENANKSIRIARKTP